MLTRRDFAAIAATAFLAGTSARPAWAAPGDNWIDGMAARLWEIEAGSGGRLGVAVIDTATGLTGGHRVNEAFPMCSTFKLLAAAAILSRVDAGRERLDRRVRFEAKHLVAYSPATEQRVGGAGMSIADLCDAAVTLSDNTAANLLLEALDGPAGLTRYARSLGDEATRLDRNEPDLNEAIAGDPRDTTTPAAMAEDLRKLVLGTALSPESRDRLTAWLVANTTGGTRLRAGLPADWRVGDKTGSGAHGTTNDVAVIWPHGREPVIVSAYLTQSPRSADERNAVLASIGRAVVAALAG